MADMQPVPTLPISTDAAVVPVDVPGEPRSFTVEPARNGERIDRYLASVVPELSRSRVQGLIVAGQTTINGTDVRDAGQKLKAGDLITVLVPPPEAAAPAGEAIPLTVVYEDDAVIVINKPAGLVVHPSAGHGGGTLVNALIAHCGDSLSGIGGVKRPGIVHRLDKDTTGLIVVAKSDAAHAGLARQFAAHGRDGKLEREYVAIVWGALPAVMGTIDAPLARNTTNRTRMQVVPKGSRSRIGKGGAWIEDVDDEFGEGPAADGDDDGDTGDLSAGDTSGGDASRLGRARAPREAITHWRIEELFSREALRDAPRDHGRGAVRPVVPLASLVRVSLETGRTHQIRVHMAHIGHPVLGDPVYGAGFKSSERRLDGAQVAALTNLGRQALHAAVLGFEHPISREPMRFESPMPPDMAELADCLRGARPKTEPMKPRKGTKSKTVTRTSVTSAGGGKSQTTSRRKATVREV
ncbi:MAG: pseudouridine synthase [Hyphomicrobium aestuarii]|nr:pseudouridine synthase [Hyphomicrobium aestuarii]